jgi:hypothetical protein
MCSSPVIRFARYRLLAIGYALRSMRFAPMRFARELTPRTCPQPHPKHFV